MFSSDIVNLTRNPFCHRGFSVTNHRVYVYQKIGFISMQLPREIAIDRGANPR